MKSCFTCADDSCTSQGCDVGACDDWTSRGEEVPAPQPDVLASLQAQINDLSHRFDDLQRAAADFIRTLEGA